jgi:Ca-activated chloride channel family protein
VLELTPEMLATDPPNRLEQARRKLFDLLQARSDAQTAIVVYAGSAHTLVPLSDDLATSRNLLDALKPSLMPESGHRADLGVARPWPCSSKAPRPGPHPADRLVADRTGTPGHSPCPRRQVSTALMLGIGTAKARPSLRRTAVSSRTNRARFSCRASTARPQGVRQRRR